MDTKALNEKLLKFVEYKKERIQGTFICYTSPDLVNSLDAQVQWIYPKLEELCYEFTIDSKAHRVAVYSFENISPSIFDSINKNLSVAFSLAVEKLIDSISQEK